MTERKLATVRRVADIRPIEGADMIHVVTVDGWKVVAQKAMGYQIGDLVVYFEIDSFIPHELAPFLTKEAAYPKEFNGVKGERLRTLTLRGQVSQGLLMPLEVAAAAAAAKFPDQKIDISFEEGDDLTEILSIQKWEAPISPQMQGQVRGTFPTQYAPKTDQERCCSADTKIMTEDGEKTIQELVRTQYTGKVLSYNHENDSLEMKSIVDWSEMTNRRGMWLKITTKTGKILIVTNNHRVYLPDLGAYRAAGELKMGDKVIIS